MAKFLIDEDLPRSISTDLAASGVDVRHVIDVGMRSHTDRAILSAAATQQWTTVTADREFGNVLVYPPALHWGVVVVRISEHRDPDARILRIVEAVTALRDEELRGAVVIVAKTKTRIRRSVLS